MKVINETGIGIGTKIVSDDGTEIGQGAEKIELVIEANSCVKAKITFGLFKVEAKAGAVEWLAPHPLKGELMAVTSIHFADGTWVTFADDGEPKAKGIAESLPLSDGRVRKFVTPLD